MKKPLQLAALLCGCLVTSVAFAQAGDKGPGFRFGNGWNLGASVSVGAFWENNAHDSTEDKESGAGWRVQPSLSLSKQLGSRSSFNTNLFYTMERGFDDEDAEDSDSYGISLGYSRKLSQRWGLSVSASYSHSENDEFYGVGWDAANPTLPRIDVDKTDNYQASAGLSYSGNKWNLSFGATWSRTDRDESWGTQSDSYGLSIGAGYKLSRTLSANLSGSMSISDPEDGDTSTSYSLMGGFTKTLSDRLSLTAMAGLSFQDYNGYEDDTTVDPSYTLSLSYKASRRIALALSMHSTYESEYYNDGYYNARTTYVWSHNLTGSMTVQWSDKLYSTLSVSGFYEEHVATVSGLGDRDRKYVQLAFNTSYRFNSYVSMYGSVSWKNDQYDYDSGDDSADDIRLDVGMTFTL
ncbi:MAG TPA: transporter [Candidatus Spyradenecus faecavium]|uniref:Transporter n=1 Tax=Candidatus Spyradenecus faecavium TaxID=2840947 RepID=A0A9D1T3W2_9BACT|nr:transporter [Candidatus Spyradenecus faecavium]